MRYAEWIFGERCGNVCGMVRQGKSVSGNSHRKRALKLNEERGMAVREKLELRINALAWK